MNIPGLPVDRRSEFDRQLRHRGIRGGIAALAAMVLVVIFSGFTTSLIVAALVFLVLYAVPWDLIRYGKYVVTGAAIVLAILYPYYQDSLFEIPLFGPFPSVDTAVTMTIYIMMAIGLNIVVGYAGLLDLGYVAFYAVGAYTAGWLASGHFQQVKVHIGSAGVNPELRGIHINMWVVLLIAGCLTAIAGILIGLPTLRLRGDYLAIVTLGFGEIIPQFVRNADNLHGFDLTHGTFGINPIDTPGFGIGLNNALGLPINF
ncbi:MAG TPA: hypothetical protein VG993_08985, partial [Actinomycetota bacterium]|nr:hypothetical protein [Actinomycetota bacterium]